MHCPFPDKTRGTVCPLCGRALPFPDDPSFQYDSIPKRVCPVLFVDRETCTEWEPLLGVGDIAGDLLHAVGVTPDRWERLVSRLASRLGFDYHHRCGCAERLAWLNDLTPWWLARSLGRLNYRFRIFSVWPPGHPGNRQER